MKKLYHVHVSYMVTGVIAVEAESEEEAEALVDDGIYDFDDVQGKVEEDLVAEFTEAAED